MNRASGVGPLAVFFDATATTSATSATLSEAFHEIQYEWSFGEDPAIGAWATGSTGASRDLATGPVAAHVFEPPAGAGVDTEYAVTVRATADGAAFATYQCLITVADPDVVFAGARTMCFSNNSDFTGCPAGATQVSNSSGFSAVTGSATAANTVRRLLLRRGHVWTVGAFGRLNRSGPGILGAFGPGSTRPVVRGTGDLLLLSDQTTPTFGDWRVMDLEFDGQSSASASAIGGNGGASNITLLRLGIHDVDFGLSFSTSTLNIFNATPATSGHAIWNHIALYHSTIQRPRTYGIFLPTERLVLQGNIIEDVLAGGQHIVRTPYIGKGVVANNTLSRPASGRHVLKIHAPTFGGGGVTGGRFTEQLVISDNTLNGGGAGVDFTAVIGPQNNIEDERVRDVLIERNWFRAGAGTRRALVLHTRETTVRNNLCDPTIGASQGCLQVEQAGVEPPPTQIRIQHNTAYSARASANFDFMFVGGSASNVFLQNNLASAPFSATSTLISGSAGAVTSSGNLLTNTANFAGTATPGVPFAFTVDFRLNPASLAVDARPPFPVGPAVFADFFHTVRPVAGATDVGATEQ